MTNANINLVLTCDITYIAPEADILGIVMLTHEYMHIQTHKHEYTVTSVENCNVHKGCSGKSRCKTLEKVKVQ